MRLGTAGELESTPAGWSLQELSGRLTELSGSNDGACLTLAISMVLDAQLQGETVAWVSSIDSTFYPPDVHDSGVDLDALAVIRVPDTRDIMHATDKLARSGAFGLVVFDLASKSSPYSSNSSSSGGSTSFGHHDSRTRRSGQRWSQQVPTAMQSRLRSLAQTHDMAILCLTHKYASSPSLGSLVSLRGEARRERIGNDRFACHLNIIKDKRRGPGWQQQQVCRGPDGLY